MARNTRIVARICLLALAEAVTSAETLRIADFEAGADGFVGALKRDSAVAADGRSSACLVNKDKRWIEARKKFGRLDHDFKELRFKVMSRDVSRVAMRLTDATGQEFQQRFEVKPDGQWQTIVVTSFDKGEIWGGAGDKKWHPPAAAILFILEHHGTLFLDSIEADLKTEVIVPDFETGLSRPGNIYSPNEEVAFSATTRAEKVSWRATDFWGDPVFEGVEAVKNNAVVIRPGAKRNGYFLLRMTAESGGKPIAERYATFAVVPRFTPSDPARSPFGVMTHFAQGMETDILPLLTRIGIVSVRDEHYWGHVEKKVGEFVFPERDNAYMSDCASNGVEPLIAMTFENKLYDGGLTPHTPEGCDAYGRYGQALLKQYGKQVKWLEIWNEYNGTWCKGPAAQDRPRYYAQMLKHAYEHVKAERPDVKVLGCATVLIPMPYIEGIFKHDGLKYMDGVVLHPYRQNPEGVEIEVGEVEDLIKRYNNGQLKPIWITETGRHDKSEDDWETGKGLYEKGRRRVARYLPRQYALLLTRNVEKIHWYLCRDYQNFVSMGLLRNVNDRIGRYAVAPAYVSYATLIRELDGARYTGRAELGRFTYVQRFETRNGPVQVCWATQPDHIALKTDKPVRVTDIMGVQETLEPLGGEVCLTLGEDVFYAHGDAQPVAEAACFRIAANQTVSLGAEPALTYELNDGGLGKAPGTSLQIAGRAVALAAPGGKASVAGLDTRSAGTHSLRYKLNAGGKLRGMGTIILNVADPVGFDGPARIVAPDRLAVSLVNTSPDKDYALKAVTCGDAARDVIAALPPSKRLDLIVPVQSLPPYQSRRMPVTARFEGRAGVGQETALSYNPCVRMTPKPDGDLGEWAQTAAIDLPVHGRCWGNTKLTGQAWMAWDDAGFYVAARVPAAADTIARLRFAVAPDYTGFWRDRENAAGWTEWAMDGKGDAARIACVFASSGVGSGEGVVAVSRRDNAGNCTWEAALPWAVLAPIKPTDGLLRLAIAVEQAAGDIKQGWVEWGGGIVMGKSPDGVRVCRLAGTVGGVTGMIQRINDLPRRLVERGGAPLTDSEVDYSKEQGRNNWQYGYYAGTGNGDGDGKAPNGPYTDDDFRKMKQVETVWGENWGDEGIRFMSLSSQGVHPGLDGTLPVWAVRRWVGDAEGLVRVSGYFQASDKKGDGVGGRVLVDGIQVFETIVGGQSRPARQDFGFTVRVAKGSRVDFAVTPGPGSHLDYDAATSVFTIHRLMTD